MPQIVISSLEYYKKKNKYFKMNKDTNFIFEAYLAKKAVLNEAPIYGDDDLGLKGDIEKAPGGGYGIGAAATKSGKTKTQVATELLTAIKNKLFKKEAHTVDGKEYQLYYPGSKMKFRSDLEKLIKSELKLGGTITKYTARIIDNLLNVTRVDAEGGTAASPADVAKAVATGVEGKPVSSSTQATAPTTPVANVYIKNPGVRFIKEWMPIFVELPDEITISKGDFYSSPELRNEVVEAITRAFDESKAKDKELVQDFIDSLKFKDSYSPASEKKEGEGTGEEPTVEEYPEDDDVTGELRSMGAIGGRRGFDPGGFSYGD